MEHSRNIQDTAETAPDDQSEVIRFLESGAGLGTPATRIDTHGAMVFLIGETALKLKRAVRYDYMDLSTMEKRHALLDREFTLNRPTAPSIYRGLKPVVRQSDGALALGGTGEPVDWVLVMQRFPPEAELTRIADAGGLDDALADRLGAAVARYHSTAPVKRLTGAILIAEILDELDRVMRPMSADLGADVERFLTRARHVWAMRSEELTARSAAGHIRRCHGDLHLRNIVVIDGEPTPFDALEFDERLGTCDTLYDLAFLLMDLDHRDLRQGANAVLNAYLNEAKADLADAGLSLLPLYLATRAAIRAMVDMQTAAVEPANDMQRDARHYLAQARACLAPPRPVLVAIGGLSGSGKTTLARQLAHRIGPAPGAIHIRSDVVRKTLLHRDPLTRLGPEGYTARMTERTYRMLHQQARDVLSQGHGVILDAVHGDPATRRESEALARELGCDFVGLWLDSPTDIRLARVADRGPNASDADADVVRAQADTDPGPIGWHRVDTDQTPDRVIDALVAHLPRQDGADAAYHGAKDVG